MISFSQTILGLGVGCNLYDRLCDGYLIENSMPITDKDSAIFLDGNSQSPLLDFFYNGYPVENSMPTTDKDSIIFLNDNSQSTVFTYSFFIDNTNKIKSYIKPGKIFNMSYFDPLNFISPANGILSLLRIFGQIPLYQKFPALFESPEYNNIHTTKSLLLFSMKKFVPSFLV
ncbi:hypothetical protein GUI12_00505 [Anaplasmataceae bacterium AB001_6]|nr:hypothetical protein GUI12_00505 [Anaplasmataceae bacterium AB001_6]